LVIPDKSNIGLEDKMSNAKNATNYLILIIAMAIVLSGCGSNKNQDLPAAPSQTPEPAAPSQTPEPTETQISIATSEYPGIVYSNFEYDGNKRFHMVYIPDSYSDTEKIPLVIYLHSYGWGAQKGMDYTQLNQVGDDFGFMIVYPSARPNWNSGIGDNPSWGTPDNNDVGYIDTLLDTLNENYNIDEGRIYAVGLSNGGLMAYKLACQLSHRIAAIASVSGVLSNSTLSDCDPLRAIPILQIHGTNDEWVPMNGGEVGWLSVEDTLNFWIQNNNCKDNDSIVLDDMDLTDDSTVEKISYTNCTNNSQIIYFKVIGGGHTWPSAGPAGYPAGATNQDINAGIEIWDFFKDYQLP
jgi:polyhydroxybutyrate depolymerase